MKIQGSRYLNCGGIHLIHIKPLHFVELFFITIIYTPLFLWFEMVMVGASQRFPLAVQRCLNVSNIWSCPVLVLLSVVEPLGQDPDPVLNTRSLVSGQVSRLPIQCLKTCTCPNAELLHVPCFNNGFIWNLRTFGKSLKGISCQSCICIYFRTRQYVEVTSTLETIWHSP